MTDTISTIVVSADFLLTGFTVGTTVWFFFFQSPFLFNLLGREKFVPIMMQMTKLWAPTMLGSVSLLLFLDATVMAMMGTTPLSSLTMLWVALSWLAIAINHFAVVPRAIKAGARSHQERKGDNNKNVKDFVIQGGSKTETKSLHQTVVLFVLIMAGSLVAHAVDLASILCA
jgi:hypothetical protein